MQHEGGVDPELQRVWQCVESRATEEQSGELSDGRAGRCYSRASTSYSEERTGVTESGLKRGDGGRNTSDRSLAGQVDSPPVEHSSIAAPTVSSAVVHARCPLRTSGCVVLSSAFARSPLARPAAATWLRAASIPWRPARGRRQDRLRPSGSATFTRQILRVARRSWSQQRSSSLAVNQAPRSLAHEIE